MSGRTIDVRLAPLALGDLPLGSLSLNQNAEMKKLYQSIIDKY